MMEEATALMRLKREYDNSALESAWPQKPESWSFRLVHAVLYGSVRRSMLHDELPPPQSLEVTETSSSEAIFTAIQELGDR